MLLIYYSSRPKIFLYRNLKESPILQTWTVEPQVFRFVEFWILFFVLFWSLWNASLFFLEFLCNSLNCSTTAKITFASFLYPQFIYIWFVSYAHHLASLIPSGCFLCEHRFAVLFCLLLRTVQTCPPWDLLASTSPQLLHVELADLSYGAKKKR